MEIYDNISNEAILAILTVLHLIQVLKLVRFISPFGIFQNLRELTKVALSFIPPLNHLKALVCTVLGKVLIECKIKLIMKLPQT